MLAGGPFCVWTARREVSGAAGDALPAKDGTLEGVGTPGAGETSPAAGNETSVTTISFLLQIGLAFAAAFSFFKLPGDAGKPLAALATALFLLLQLAEMRNYGFMRPNRRSRLTRYRLGLAFYLLLVAVLFTYFFAHAGAALDFAQGAVARLQGIVRF